LIIVDNFPFRQDINTINPEDVLNITILKDAAAASIWGAQAGNGVIVITTKKGKYNQPLYMTLNTSMTVVGKPDLYYYPQLSIPDVVDLQVLLFNKGMYDAALLRSMNSPGTPAISPLVELLAKRRDGKLSSVDSAMQIDAIKGMDLRRDLD